MASIPSLFVAHGAPDLPLGDHPAKHFLVKLPNQLPKPKSILIISAHWEAAVPTLTTATTPKTIYDFVGWPSALNSMQYRASTDTKLIKRTKTLLNKAGLAVKENAEHGYDHGTWIPLLLMYPDANIPVVQLSLQRGASARQHFEIGKALTPLRDEGVLIIGSGAAVHNLSSLAPEATPVPNWAQDFDQWLNSHIKARNLKHLLEFPKTPNEARQAHPSLEHLMPLFVAMGAGWEEEYSSRIHHSYSYGSISMASYVFGGKAQNKSHKNHRNISHPRCPHARKAEQKI